MIVAYAMIPRRTPYASHGQNSYTISMTTCEHLPLNQRHEWTHQSTLIHRLMHTDHPVITHIRTSLNQKNAQTDSDLIPKTRRFSDPEPVAQHGGYNSETNIDRFQGAFNDGFNASDSVHGAPGAGQSKRRPTRG